MECRVEGCLNKVRYKSQSLCQAHYHRMWRNGTLETKAEKRKRETGATRNIRVVMPGKGYVHIYSPDHPLRMAGGYVAEHRMVVYEIYGDKLPPCELCGKSINWKTCHIDHIDECVSNNDPSNLRPLCRNCNVRRNYPEQHTFSGRSSIAINGVTKTAREWVRELGLNISSATVLRRIRAGYSGVDALFSEKKTHNGKVPQKKPAPPKFTRKNSIPITINGQVMTAAEWARQEKCSVSDSTIRSRIRSGWSHFDAVFTAQKSQGR